MTHFPLTPTADETYYQLKRSLLPVRGRPPALPDVHLTNRLLLQLKALQIEGNKTYKSVSLVDTFSFINEDLETGVYELILQATGVIYWAELLFSDDL